MGNTRSTTHFPRHIGLALVQTRPFCKTTRAMLCTVVGLFLGDGAILKVGGERKGLPIVVQYITVSHYFISLTSHAGYVLVFYCNRANNNYYCVCCLVIGNRKFTISLPSGDKIRVGGCSGDLRLTFTTALPYTVQVAQLSQKDRATEWV